MIDTLLAACKKQKQHVSFGPTDIKGSFEALVKRGLIIRTEVKGYEKKELQWQVTRQAILMLKFWGLLLNARSN